MHQKTKTTTNFPTPHDEAESKNRTFPELSKQPCALCPFLHPWPLRHAHRSGRKRNKSANPEINSFLQPIDLLFGVPSSHSDPFNRPQNQLMSLRHELINCTEYNAADLYCKREITNKKCFFAAHRPQRDNSTTKYNKALLYFNYTDSHSYVAPTLCRCSH